MLPAESTRYTFAVHATVGAVVGVRVTTSPIAKRTPVVVEFHVGSDLLILIVLTPSLASALAAYGTSLGFVASHPVICTLGTER
jgi:phosphate/sulfate permease